VLVIGVSTLGRDRSADETLPALEPNRVLVLPYTNQTGDPNLDRLGDMTADWITQGLAETSLVRAVSTIGAQAATGTVQTEDRNTAARSRAEDHQAAIVVYGSYYVRGDSITFQTQITDVSTGTVLRSIGEVSVSAENAFEAVETLRQRVTGALATALDPRLQSWATAVSQPPSYEAYLLYAEGMDAFLDSRRSAPFLSAGRSRWQGSMRDAADQFMRAAALDTAFFVPVLWAIRAHTLTGDWASAESLAAGLEEHRNRLTQWERALLDAGRAFRRRDYAAEYRAYSRLVDMTPGTQWTFNLADVAYRLNRYEEAVDLLTSIDAENGWITSWEPYWERLATSRHLLGEHEQELQDARTGLHHVPESARLRLAEIRASGAVGRIDGLLPRDDGESFVLVEELLRHGHDSLAEDMIADRFANYDPGQDTDYRNTTYWLEKAGRADEAKAIFEGVLESDPDNLWVVSRMGELAAKRGDRDQALEMLAMLNRADASAREEANAAYYKARIVANLGDNEEAVRLLRHARATGWRRSAMWLHVTPYLPQALREYQPFKEFLR
jgi:tetratricopeptide (TPR) repeat protein